MLREQPGCHLAYSQEERDGSSLPTSSPADGDVWMNIAAALNNMKYFITSTVTGLDSSVLYQLFSSVEQTVFFCPDTYHLDMMDFIASRALRASVTGVL